MCARLNQNFKQNDFPVTYEQWQILSRLYEENGQTQNQLAILNERDQPSISRLIDNMMKRSLVKRGSHPHDRRINLVYLTEESIQIQHELESLAFKTILQASDGIDEKEMETCLRVLDQVRENLK
ncbi:MarR family winged helix-turn-helix transcriptional regulator [Bacillus taeanensis]|nr:MarR family transcriptional regulator [Bacillus taeanensis]